MRELFNDNWSFYRAEPGTGYEEAMKQRELFHPVELPHDWLIGDTQNLYRDGDGFYRKSFCLHKEEEKRYSVIFEGVYMDTAVYVNGCKAGEWKYGYSTFEIDLTAFLTEGENELVVSVCFRSPNSRWYSGAGIYRDVWFKVTEQVCIEENGVYVHTCRAGDDTLPAVQEETAGDVASQAQTAKAAQSGTIDDEGIVITQEGEQDHWLLMVDTTIRGLTELGAVSEKERQRYALRHTLYERLSKAPEEELPAEALLGKETALTCVERHTQLIEGDSCVYEIRSPKRWDVDAPFLYVLKTELLRDGEVIGEEYATVGFRECAFDPAHGFFLNGRHLKLNGVCEHHDLGALGAAFHRPAMARKFRILKEMGVNALRGSHNMTAPAVVELADEMGILMISEAFDMWELSKTTYDYARFFKEWSSKDVESWVKRDRNHPSVILFSIGNEIYDTHVDAHGVAITKYLRDLVKQYDYRGNAGITIGSNYMPWENAQKCADELKIAGYNYAEKYYEEHHAAHPDWVIYGSETSSIVQSRGIYHFPYGTGILSDDDEQCSSLGNSPTSWGAKSMEDCICQDRDMEFSMGQFLWTGFDYIGEPTPYHTKNSYFGQVDTAGFPKDAYYVWQSAWTDYRTKPMVHVFPYWDFNEGQQIDVRVCSNAPVVELFLNGVSLGRQELTHEPHSGKHVIADYRVSYQSGELLAVAYDRDGTELAREEKRSFGNSSRIVVKAEKDTAKATGRDLIFVQIGTVDEAGNPVENATDRVTVRVEGAGRLVGLDNGDSTDPDSYKGISRRLFSGKLLAIIQTKDTPGKITVEVTGRGLMGAVLTCVALPAEEASLCAGMRSARGIAAAIPVSGEAALKWEENRQAPVLLGTEDEIPVRKICLSTEKGQEFSKELSQIAVNAVILPENATDQRLSFRLTDAHGVTSNLAELTVEGHTALIKAKGDGAFYLRCTSGNGTDGVRIISQLEFAVKGLGQAYLNPYELISGSLYSSYTGEVSNGNERGVATARDGETVITFTHIDFGRDGSDRITIPIFALNDEEYPVRIYEGIPGQQGSELLADVVYQKPSIWNTYQPETYTLAKRLTGITSLSICVTKKVHIKGFFFERQERAFMQLFASQADSVYGDTFTKEEQAVTGIGNNVSLEFREMDFGKEGTERITIRGRAPKGSNSLHIRLYNGTQEEKQLIEFPMCEVYEEHSFALSCIEGKWDVTFVFLPGSCFDFDSFRFEQNKAGTEEN